MTGERRAGRGSRQALVPLFVSWTAASVLLLVVALQSRVPLDELFLDASQVGGQHWYAGLMTSLGVLMWTVAVCGCVVTSFVTKLGDRTKAAVAFRSAAFVFGLLLLDDLFLLHSNLFPSVTGLPKIAFLAAEAALAWLWLVPALPELRRTRWELLAAAAVGFAISLVVDFFFNGRGDLWLLAEDGTKFLGVVALATWSSMTAADVMRSVVTQRVGLNG